MSWIPRWCSVKQEDAGEESPYELWQDLGFEMRCGVSQWCFSLEALAVNNMKPGPVGRQALAGTDRWIILSSLSKYC